MKSSVLLAFTALALCSSAVGQSTLGWSHHHTDIWDVGTVGPGRQVTRMLAGEVTGGAQLDVLALGGVGGTQLLLLDAVETDTAMLLHGATVRDFDLKPKDAGTGLEELVYVDSTGLWRSPWNPGDGFDAAELITTPVGQPWANARKVRCGYVDATTGLDYVGLAQNQRRVMYYGGTEWSTADTGPRIYEMLLIDWVGDAKLEIALLMQNGVSILDATSAEIANFPRTYLAGDAIAAVRTGTGSIQGVAWLAQQSGSAPTLSVLTSSGAAPASLDLAEAVALRAGDADNDGLDDLIFARADALAPSWLRNSGTAGAPNFTEATRAIAVPDPGVPPPTVPGCAPLVTDLNNDELADLFVPVGGTSMAALVFLVAEYTPIEPPADPPGGGLHEYPVGGGLALNADPIPGFFPRCGGELDGGAFEYSGTTLSLSAYFDVIPATANHLELRLWKRQIASGPNPPYTEPVCQLLRYFPLPSPEPNPDFTFRAIKDIPTIQLSESLPCEERALWVEMRLIQATGVSGNPSAIVKAWPMYTAVLLGGCAAVDNMMPSASSATHGMEGSGLDSDCSTVSELFECNSGYDLIACLPMAPGSTPAPFVRIPSKRPLPPGTVPSFPAPSSNGTVTANDVP